MDIKFYNNLSDPDTVNKELSGEIITIGYLKDDTNIIDPNLVINKIDGLKSIPTYNYFYIGGSIKRYYYVTDMTSIRNGTWLVKGHVDVLMSFKEYFLKLSGMIERTADPNLFNAYVRDDSKTITSQRKTQIKRFPIGFGEPSFLLTTAGGA